MTSVLGRYVFAHLTRSVTFVTLAILGLFFVVDLLDNLGRTGLEGPFASLRDTLLSMPLIIQAALPPSCAVGCAVGLGVLDGRREMTLLRITGTSAPRLCVWITAASLVWVALFVAVNEYLLPGTAQVSRDIEVKRSGSLLATSEEIWIKTGEGYARIGSLSADGTTVGQVWTFAVGEETLERVRMAQEAVHDEGGWAMSSVTEATLGEDGWVFEDIPSMAWPDGPSPDLLQSFTIKHASLPTASLLDISRSLRALGQNTVAIDLVIWSRLFDALSITILMLASLTLVRYRTTAGTSSARNMAALSLVLMMSYYYLQVIVRQQAIDSNWPGALGAALPTLIVLAALSVWLTTRKRK